MVILARLSLAGFPFLSGFYSKDIILEIIYIINTNFLILGFIIISTILTVTYSLRLMYYRVWRGLLESSFLNYYETDNIINPIIFIGVIVVFLGRLLRWAYFPNPIFINLSFFCKGFKFIDCHYGGFGFYFF